MQWEAELTTADKYSLSCDGQIRQADAGMPSRDCHVTKLNMASPPNYFTIYTPCKLDHLFIFWLISSIPPLSITAKVSVSLCFDKMGAQHAPHPLSPLSMEETNIARQAILDSQRVQS